MAYYLDYDGLQIILKQIKAYTDKKKKFKPNGLLYCIPVTGFDWSQNSLSISFNTSEYPESSSWSCIACIGTSSQMSSWRPSEGAHIFIYYIQSTNTLRIQYLTSSTTAYFSRDISDIGNDITVTISQTDGVTVKDSENIDNTYEASNFTDLFTLTDFCIGSIGGNPSYAVYDGIDIL